jgi:shikimate dehydrogenase
VSGEVRLRVGVIGDPVAHSISPAMQQPALDALGIPATYERWHTTTAELRGRIESLRAPDVLGANVTVPHKLAVMPLLDNITDLARRAGAVNTIVNSEGRLRGDNTDIHGFATALLEVRPGAPDEAVLVLGAGGAARAVVLAMDSIGVRRIAIHNRDSARADRLAAELELASLNVVESAGLDRELRTASIVVNATSLGWHSGESPLTLQQVQRCLPGALIADLTYRETDLLREAKNCSLATLDGLSMLVHQGARALEFWTGRPAPVELMMQAALAARMG